MSFESFRVELRGGAAGFEAADAAVRGWPGSRTDPDALPSPGSRFYAVADDDHVIEVEVADAPVRVSCRFTLCHPATVDAAFLRLVYGLVGRLGMSVRVCDDVPPDDARDFPPSRFPEFAAAALRAIAARRAEWAANFGPETLAATTPEAFERFVTPRCQPAPR